MLKDLCSALTIAKAREQLAREEVLRIENEILATVPNKKLEGTDTFAADGFKVTLTSKLTRKLDFDSYLALNLPENLSFVDLSPKINLKKLRAIEMVDPAIVARCVTVSPAKTSVKVEEVEG